MYFATKGDVRIAEWLVCVPMPRVVVQDSRVVDVCADGTCSGTG
jgi:hypothetical protein